MSRVPKLRLDCQDMVNKRFVRHAITLCIWHINIHVYLENWQALLLFFDNINSYNKNFTLKQLKSNKMEEGQLSLNNQLVTVSIILFVTVCLSLSENVM